MRAKYIAKTARRRTIRPDGDEYRVMRRWKTEGRSRRRKLQLQWLAAGAIVAVACIYFFMLRG